MNETIHATLAALRDVQGVQGSFMLAAGGHLSAMQMPALFDESMFDDLGPRIERLSEAFASLGDELESCIVRFSDHVLCVRRFSRGGALCVLATHSVNLPALKMAMNLADRRLSGMHRGPDPAPPATNGKPAHPPPLATTIPAAAAAAPSTGPSGNGNAPGAAQPATPPKVARYYRGHLVED